MAGVGGEGKWVRDKSGAVRMHRIYNGYTYKTGHEVR